MPYFRILVDEETSEAILSLPRILIGRERSLCDIPLEDQTVSRVHCLLVKLGQEYSVVDLHSSSGTLVNGQSVTRHELTNGDNIEVGGVIMEYRTDNDRTVASMQELRSADEGMLLDNFRMLPSGVRVRYRIVYLSPEKMFSIGDTLMVGQGGVLLPINTLADVPNECVFELELTWPNGRKKFFMGEFISKLDFASCVCLKMHEIEKKKYDSLVGPAKRGNWIDTADARENSEDRLARWAKRQD